MERIFYATLFLTPPHGGQLEHLRAQTVFQFSSVLDRDTWVMQGEATKYYMQWHRKRLTANEASKVNSTALFFYIGGPL